MIRLFCFIVFCITFAPQLQGAVPESRLHGVLRFTGEKLPESQRFGDDLPPVVLYVGNGVWDVGVEHLKMFFSEHHIGYRTAVGSKIQQGILNEPGVRLLVMPGGESWEYLAELSRSGAEAVRAFVGGGGGYVGICAGAFYAMSHRLGGYATGEYGIGLLDGTAYDGTALQTPPFIEGMMDIHILPLPWSSGFKSLYRMVMFGGPSFRFTPEEALKKQVQVFARFQPVDEPAMVLFQFGKGRVFLSGPHLEIEEERTDWSAEFTDPESDWPILRRAVSYLMP